MEIILNTDTSYVVLSKRYFSRYILTYEVLALPLCNVINGSPIFCLNELNTLITSGLIDEKDVVLELQYQNATSADFISYSMIKTVWFTSQHAIDQFKERSYENYDVTTLQYGLLPDLDKSVESIPVEFRISEPVSKEYFTSAMTSVDALLALLHQYFKESKDDKELLISVEKVVNSRELLLKLVLNLGDIDNEHSAFALTFFDICLQNGIDKGWIPTEIITNFKSIAPREITETETFKIWASTVRKLANGEDVNLEFTDEKSIALRAMTLVLMNPEKEHLEVIKMRLGDMVGEKVYKLALSFALARTGYSFFNDSERNAIGNHRKTLQLINAHLHNLENNPSQVFIFGIKAPHKEQTNTLEYKDSSLNFPWLTKIDNSPDIFEIAGLKPFSGFDLRLIYIPEDYLVLRIIDASGPKGMTKFAGQLIKELINVQSQLPDHMRFEMNDSGLILTLPLSWAETNEFRLHLVTLLNILAPLKLTQKSSNFC